MDTFLKIFTYFMLILFFLGPIGVIAFLVFAFKKNFNDSDDDMDMYRVKVKVLYKNIEDKKKGKNFYASFITDDERVINLKVSESNYNRITERETGELLFNGDRFLDFKTIVEHKGD